MQTEFWPSTGRESPDGETSRRFYPTPRASDADRGGRGELLHVAKGAPTPRGSLDGSSTSSRPASPARTSATRGPGLVSTESGQGYGGRPPASFARFDPDTCSWRTSQRSLLGGWIPFSGRWTRSVMWANHTACRLPTLAPRISGTGSSFWGTPLASPRHGRPSDCHHGARLANQASNPRLWPTPAACNPNDGESTESWLARRERVKKTAKNGNGMGTPLSIAVKLWPTPTVHGNDNRAGASPKSGDGLGTAARRAASTSSGDASEPTGPSTPPTHLNPRWVEWLMGFPDGWTDCGG